MKMLYVVNTKQDADAYRVYARVHMDGRVSPVNQIVSLVSGLLITSGGILATVQQGPKVLYIASIIVGLLVLAGRPLGLHRMRNRINHTRKKSTSAHVHRIPLYKDGHNDLHS